MNAELRIDPADWPAAIADVAGPQLVVAGPGAGKTEFLVRRAVHLVEARHVPPEQILLLSFSRRGAADLRRRITAALDRSVTVVPAATFHSVALRLLEAHGPGRYGWHAAPALLTGPEQVSLVAELLSNERPEDWPITLRGLLATRSFADEVADFLLRAREHLLDPPALAQRAAERPEWRALPAFLERYTAALREHHRIDYGTLQATAVELLEDPGIAASVAEQFRYVLVDEYQDTTIAQARLLRGLYSGTRNLTAAGDPYQSIYSFRGAEVGNIAAFPETFSDHEGRAARRIVLTTSFRVPSEILDAAVRVTAGGALPGAAGAVVPAPGRGSVDVYAFDQQSHEAEWIAAEIQRIHLRDGIPYRRVAVLVRSTRRVLPELSRALERRGIPHDQPDRRLVDHRAVRLVLDVVRAATASDPERTAAVRRLLLGPLWSLPLSAVRAAQRTRAATDEPWPSVLRTSVPGGAALADLLERPDWATAVPAADGFWTIWSSLGEFSAAVNDPARGSDRAAWSSLGQVLERLSERNPAATLHDYLEWSEAEDFEATPLLEFRPSAEDRLTLTTLHQAKGQDFDVVFIADAVDGVFPDLRRRESLLGVRHLAPGRTDDPAAYTRFRLQEEMRLAYTAMCRASRRVVWTFTSTGFEDGRGLPSRFLPLVAGVATIGDATRRPEEPGPPSTPLEAESRLRRLLRDPFRSPAERLAALAALVEDAPWRPRHPGSFAGVPERGPDVGLVPADLTMSPSQADAYLTCPRLYAFRRRLHVDADGSTLLALGSLVHEVLEEVEAGALRDGRPHADGHEAIAALDRRWDPTSFGGGTWSAAWRRRAERIITHLYEQWPGRGRVAAVEHPIELEVDGTLWRGRIDRVEQETQGESTVIRIVDYKTGTSAATNEQASASVQLGFYAMATRADPLLASLGEVAGAEFWYPAVKQKSVATRSFDIDRLPDVALALDAAVRGIRAEDWTPITGPACDRCPVRLVCPEWPEGREAFAS
jgi:superfamily I DNA/RNA helicase/RecB family exonuclease